MVAKTRTLDALTSAKRERDSSEIAEGARSLQYLGIALLLVIALVAGVTAGTIFGRPQTPTSSPGLAASSETARTFYDALNQALAGVGTEALEALLGPGFLDHDASVGESQSANEFLDRVGTLGQTPGVTLLSVESIEISSSSLIVQVSQAEQKPHELAGISVEQPKGQPLVEVLRVARGRVIDRWTPGITWLQATELEEAVVRAPGLADIATTLVRIDIPAGVVHRLPSVERGFLLIESGSAVMHAVRVNGDEETLGLDLGSATSVTSAARIELRSADEEPVTALVYALMRRGATDVRHPTSKLHAWPEEATQSLLWSGVSPRANEGTMHRLARIVLEAGNEIRVAGAMDATLVLAIDSGTIELVAPGGSISILGEDFWPVEHANFASIDAKHSASLTGASAVTLRNVSERPVTIMLVVIKAEAQSESPNGSNP